MFVCVFMLEILETHGAELTQPSCPTRILWHVRKPSQNQQSQPIADQRYMGEPHQASSDQQHFQQLLEQRRHYYRDLCDCIVVDYRAFLQQLISTHNDTKILKNCIVIILKLKKYFYLANSEKQCSHVFDPFSKYTVQSFQKHNNLGKIQNICFYNQKHICIPFSSKSLQATHKSQKNLFIPYIFTFYAYLLPMLK